MSGLGRRHPRTGRRAPAVGVLAVVALLSGCEAGRPATSGSGAVTASPRTPDAAPEASEPPVAPRWRRLSSVGIEVDVPASWPVNAWSGCSPPPSAEVVRAPGVVAGCGNDAFVASVVSFGPTTDDHAGGLNGSPAPTGRPTTLAGATPSDGSVSAEVLPDGRVQTVVSFPDRPLGVHVTSPDEELVARIAGSVREVAVDLNGCATDLPAAPAWDSRRPGPGVRVSDPAAIAVCLYEPYGSQRAPAPLLAASTTLTGSAATGAARTLDQAHPGPLPDQPSECAADLTEDTLAVLHIRDQDGAVTEARVHFEHCTDRWVATSTGISQVTVAQLTALFGPLSTGYAYGGDLPAR